MSLVYRSASLPGLEALSCRTDFTFEPHMHSGAVLWLNSGGGERFSVRGNSEVLQPGCLSLIEAGEIHANQPCGSGPRDLRSLYLEDVFFADLARRFELASLRSPQCTRVVADARLWRETAALHQAIMNNADALIVEQQTLQVFAAPARPLPPAGRPGTGSEEQWFGTVSDDRLHPCSVSGTDNYGGTGRRWPMFGDAGVAAVQNRIGSDPA